MIENRSKLVVFDVIEFPDVPMRLAGNRRRAGCGEFVEASAPGAQKAAVAPFFLS